MTIQEMSQDDGRLRRHEWAQIKLLVFDLDGVITSERPYWDSARRTVREVIESNDYLGLTNFFNRAEGCPTDWEQCKERVIAENLIYEFKNRAVNSNWDLTFLAAGLYLVASLAELRRTSPAALLDVLSGALPTGERLNRLGQLLSSQRLDVEIGAPVIQSFLEQTGLLQGTALLEYLSHFAEQRLGAGGHLFLHKGQLWEFCRDNFQEWHLEKTCLTPGSSCRAAGETAVDAIRLKALLEDLYNAGRYTLGIATGRPWQETVAPLRALGLFQYFDERRIVTNDAVEEAEAALARMGRIATLGKPHPFVLLKAIYPEHANPTLCIQPPRLDHGHVAYVGDSASDVVAALRAGCRSIGVLSGVSSDETFRRVRHKILADLGCELILNSVLDLPTALQS